MPTKDPEKLREKRRRYAAKHREELKAYRKAYYMDNATQFKAQVINARFIRNYGMTYVEVMALFDAQGDLCACCGRAVSRPATGAKRADVGNVDHCHTSGKVRGILCTSCNVALGLLNDRPDLAVKYLERQT